MTKQAIRLAVIGCGAVSEVCHFPALKKIGWRPAVCVDPNMARAQIFASEFGGRAVSGYRDALDDFDTALVAVPHHLHVKICCDLFANGKSVLVEKPMASTVADCRKIIAAAEKAGQTLGVGMFRRHFHAVGWTKAFLDDGGLGELESFDIEEGGVFQWPLASDALWRKKSAGGGVLLDTGVHTLDTVTWWLEGMRVIEYKDDSYGGVEADCKVTLSLSNGATGTVELSRTRALRNSAILRGKKGSLEVSFPKNEIRAEPADLLDRTFNDRRGSQMPHQSFPTLFAAQLRDWKSSLTEGREPMVTGRRALPAIEVIERCYKIRQPWELPWIRPKSTVRHDSA